MKAYIPTYGAFAGKWIYEGYKNAWEEKGFTVSKSTRDVHQSSYTSTVPYTAENLSEDYIMMAPTARISSKGDQGLELHQDAIGETGLLFLLTPQKKGSTVMLRSSHKFPGRIANYLSWNSKKLVNLISKISTDITGDSGDYYFWFHKTWHGRKKNIQKDEKEKYTVLETN